MVRSLHFAALTSALVLLSACGGGSSGACDGPEDCGEGRVCVDQTCQDRVARDSGTGEPDAGVDAGMSCPALRVCGELCCDEGERCGGGSCCAPEDLCAGVCCGAGQACVADTCVLSCQADESPCGDRCCGGTQVCYLGECLDAAECARPGQCQEDEYCDETVGRCLPRRETGEACEYRPEIGEFELEEEWNWSGDPDVMSSHNQVMMAPMVANLTDDNGDGAIDEQDVPDVIFNTFASNNYWEDGVLRAVSGADGTRIWPTAAPSYRTTPGGELAIGELVAESPGPEIVACSASNRTARTPGYLMIIAADGSEIRRFDTEPNVVRCGFDAVALGDMNHDGVPEIALRTLLAHADGTLVRVIRDESAAAGGTYAVLYDVDADGDLELVTGNAAFEYDGTAVWDRSTGDSPLGDAQIALADLDGNDSVELVRIGSGHFVEALDAATGETLWGPIDINPPELAGQVAANGNPNGGGPPTIANFDEDPEREIAFAGGYAYVIFNHDGTRLWWYETVDRSSRSTGSSLFDFEGDGVAEVLYNDERTFRVFRGPDGTIYRERCNLSGTIREFPIVVDVDNDDHAEIVLMENNYAFGGECLDGSPASTGIHVFGDPADQWVRTRRIWNQHTYHVTNVAEDGTIPTAELPNWRNERLNNFRQNVQPDGLFDAPDLVLEDLAAISSGCPEELGFRVRVVNQGRAGAREGVPVTVYVVSGETRTFVGRATTPRALLPGESVLLEISPPFPLPEPRQTYEFVAVLNDPADMPLAGVNECRDENNESALLSAACTILD